jgi:hypothetical protein
MPLVVPSGALGNRPRTLLGLQIVTNKECSNKAQDDAN